MFYFEPNPLPQKNLQKDGAVPTSKNEAIAALLWEGMAPKILRELHFFILTFFIPKKHMVNWDVVCVVRSFFLEVAICPFFVVPMRNKRK